MQAIIQRHPSLLVLALGVIHYTQLCGFRIFLDYSPVRQVVHLIVWFQLQNLFNHAVLNLVQDELLVFLKDFQCLWNLAMRFLSRAKLAE